MDMRNHIKNSNAIEDIESEKEVEQSLVAWDKLIKEKVLSHGLICQTQRIITENQVDLKPLESGYYRSVAKINVFVGTHYAPMWHMVDGLMGNWLLDYADPKLDFDPMQAHIRFEYVHPFVDGNGRTGRMLLWWHQIKKGQEPTLFKAEEKYEKYYPMFQKAEA